MLIAAHAYPELDVGSQMVRLDRLAERCTEPTLEAWRRLLWVDEGFAGNAVDYYDPRNSFLNDVLDRRIGIPITLAVVGMEVGRRIGLPLAGVGMPGHFLLANGSDVFVDPFAGVVLDREGCERLFRRVAGGDAVFDPAYLEPVGPRAILARMLANLRLVYGRLAEAGSLAWVLRLRLAMPGTSPADRAELARALAGAGRFGEGAAELETLAGAGAIDDPDAVRRQAVALRARLN